MIYLLFGAIGFLAGGFTGAAIGVVVAVVVEFVFAAVER